MKKIYYQLLSMTTYIECRDSQITNILKCGGLHPPQITIINNGLDILLFPKYIIRAYSPPVGLLKIFI